jgi:hypothetical protein
VQHREPRVPAATVRETFSPIEVVTSTREGPPMGPVNSIVNSTSSITMSKPFSEGLDVHLPKIQAPTAEDLLEDQLVVGPVSFSHLERVDVT